MKKIQYISRVIPVQLQKTFRALPVPLQSSCRAVAEQFHLEEASALLYYSPLNRIQSNPIFIDYSVWIIHDGRAPRINNSLPLKFNETNALGQAAAALTTTWPSFISYFLFLIDLFPPFSSFSLSPLQRWSQWLFWNGQFLNFFLFWIERADWPMLGQ